MNYNEVLAAARECSGPYCKACPVCNGRACGNSMPGPGSKFPGNVAARTMISGRRYASTWIPSAPITLILT